MKMDKRTELKGLIKEVQQEVSSSEKLEIEAKFAAQDEKNTKILEENKELKAKLDSMQGKIITMHQKTGVNTYLFSGYNPDLSKNFKSTLSTDNAEKVAKVILEQAKKKYAGEVNLTAAFDGANAVPVEYGNAVMGLAELSSVALKYAKVIQANAPVIKLPSKGTRDAIDSQASGTANREGTSTIGQITWTIDKRVGNYIEIRNDQLDDAVFDLVNMIIVPFQAEAIGQNVDDEMFNGTEFTTSVADVTAAIDSTADDSINFANLNTMFYHIEWERLGAGADPKWFGPRSALKNIAALTDTYGRPIFHQVPINGKPSQTLFGAEYVITPAIATAPATGKLRLAFGDPSQYVIFIRGSQFVSMVNPYIKMKEDITQFVCKARMDGNIADHATAASSKAWAVMKEE
jgi:HK97 family phage major capsid protein